MLLSGTITVNDSTPTLLVDGSTIGEYTVHLRVVQDIVVGDSGVSTSDGLLVTAMTDNTEIFTAQIQGDSLYAVAVAGTAAVGVLAYSS